MMRANRKMNIIFYCFFVCFLVSFLSIKTYAKEQWITEEKEICVLKGATRMLEMETTSVDDKKISVKKVASVKIKDFYVKIKGLKKGKTTVTFSIPEINKKYIIHVTVLSKSKVRKKSQKALEEYLDKKTDGTKYVYVDLNRDGLKELFLKKKIAYYNYETQKVETVRHNFSSVYTCKKNTMLFCELKKKRKTKEFTYLSEFYTPDLYQVFALEGTGTGFRKYTTRGKKVYGVSENYAYYDYGYDQDDYEYEAFTKQQMKNKIAKKMPKNKKLIWKKK